MRGAESSCEGRGLGSALAVLGAPGDPGVELAILRMSQRSPCRGAPSISRHAGLALGVQSLGWDASHSIGDRYCVALHGYVGNRQALLRRLGVAGEAAASDAAMLGALLDDQGIGVLCELRGEYAVVVLDSREGVLHLARDAMGLRPLCFSQRAGRLIVGTEPRQVVAGIGQETRIDHEGLLWYLLRDGSSERTLFEGVLQVTSGAIWSFSVQDPSAAPAVQAFWRPPAERDQIQEPLPALARELRRLLEDAVDRVMPPIPVGVELSGGLDSSTVWALVMERARNGDSRALQSAAFGDGFPGVKGADETGYIEEMLRFAAGQGFILDATAVLRARPRRELDSRVDWVLYPDAAVVLNRFVEVSNRGYRVLLGGQGGDEWLGGSARYLAELLLSGRWLTWGRDLLSLALHFPVRDIPLLIDVALASPMRRAAREWIGMTPRTRGSAVPGWVHSQWRDFNDNSPSADAQAEPGSFRGLLLGQLRFTRSNYGRLASEQLLASVGLERRHPLMDLDLVDFAFRLPPRAVMTGEIPGKWYKNLLRLAVADLLPPHVLQRRDKALRQMLYDDELAELRGSVGERLQPLLDCRLAGGAGLDKLVRRYYDQRDSSATLELWRLVEVAEVIKRLELGRI